MTYWPRGTRVRNINTGQEHIVEADSPFGFIILEGERSIYDRFRFKPVCRVKMGRRVVLQPSQSFGAWRLPADTEQTLREIGDFHRQSAINARNLIAGAKK